jgi:hypothetical protein
MTDERDDDIVDDPPEQPEEPARPAYDPEVAEEARFFGWKAPEEWVGDKPSGYIDDPVRFLDRIKDSRIFKASEQRFESKLNDVAARLARVTDNVIARQKTDYETRLSQIQQAQRQAVETADVQRFEQLEREKLTLAPPARMDAPSPPPADPVVQDYIEKNEWAKDPALRFEGAQAIEVALRQGRQFRDYGEQLQYAETVMRRKYPHMFQAAPPAAASRTTRVDGGGLGIGGAKSGFDALPTEAKSAFKRFVAQGVFEDSPAGRKQYVEDYNA